MKLETVKNTLKLLDLKRPSKVNQKEANNLNRHITN